MRDKPWTDKQWLYDRYVVKHMSCDAICKELNELGISVTMMTVFNHCRDFGLIKNSRRLGKRSVGGNSKNKRGYYG